jgi:hypothetical protein
MVQANGNKISVFSEVTRGGSLSLLGLAGQDTADPDSADGIYHWFSIDGGAQWNGEWISLDGDTNLTNRREYEQNFSTWPFQHYVVDNTEVTHHVRSGLNTSTVVTEGDTIFFNVSHVAYWNDKHKNWINLSRKPAEIYAYDFALASGNFNGVSFPWVAADATGNVVVTAWHVPQFSGELGNSSINTYPGDGGDNPSPYYYNDLVYAYSVDGGATWSDPETLVSEANVENYFVNIFGVDVVGSEVTVHYSYYFDEIPGGAIVGQNSFGTNCIWKYNTATFTVTSVDDDANDFVVNDFGLEQNYPNPFNPSTAINYSLPERSDVTIKIYDMLGEEVATIVNTTQEAGSYEINFDASNLASGMYIYRLNAGNVLLSKKMILLK